MKEGADEQTILLVINGAGRIHEASARFDGLGCIFQNGSLQCGQPPYFFRRNAPAHIHPALNNACVGAGDIQQNGVKVFLPFGGAGLGPVGLNDFQVAGAIFEEIFTQCGEAVLLHIRSGEPRLASGDGNNGRRFATRSGACIQNVFIRLGGQKVNGVAGRGVCYVEGSVFDIFQREGAFHGKPARRSVQRVKGISVAAHGNQGIGTDIKQGCGVIPFKQSKSSVFAELQGPSVHQP